MDSEKDTYDCVTYMYMYNHLISKNRFRNKLYNLQVFKRGQLVGKESPIWVTARTRKKTTMAQNVTPKRAIPFICT